MGSEQKTDRQPENDDKDAPSVEAEIVDAEFTDASDAGETDAKASEGTDAGAAGLAKLKIFGIRSPFSPGVTLFSAFAAMVVVAIIVFLFWRAQTAPTETAAPTAATKSPAAKQSAEVKAPATGAPVKPATQDKIANAIPSDAKSIAAAAIDPETAPASARGLPPAPPGGSKNNELQSAAKEAMRGADADKGDAIDLGSAPNAPEITFESTALAPTSEPSAPPVAESVEPNVIDAGSAPIPRERGASAAAETDIAALRLSFERALSERDARANAEIADLKSRLDTMQTSPGVGRDSRASAAAIAFVNLERAAASGGPYTEELDDFARLKPDSALANRLRASAAKGAPTLDELKESFDTAVRAALAGAAREGATGWMSGILARIQEFVTVRPARPQAGAKPGQVISRAESALARGDLAAAVSELGVLQGAAAAEFAPWIAGARARLEIDETIASLNGALMGEFQN